MTGTSLAIKDPDELRDKIASLMMQGRTEYSVAKELGIKRVEVINYYSQWKDMLAHDMSARDTARDHLNQMVKHYDTLIFQANNNLSNLKELSFDEKVSAQINATLKNIADFDAKRVDLLQKAGLLESGELGDQLAEMEEKQEVLINILRNDLCPDCQRVVARKLHQVTNKVEAVVIHGDNLNE